jgi:two-component system CheB/CheR fusion protein
MKRKKTSKRAHATSAGAPSKSTPRRPSARSSGKPPAVPPVPRAQNDSFPIVGIGASAGGLEALERFLKKVPDGSGMAFVVIQHLDPMHKGTMVELLQRATKMPVLQVEDAMPVEPDHVYVIPPGKDMSILHGVLHLLPRENLHGLNLPIDFFFRSLADDQQERGIAVILSGMGSDGTLGLRAIKEKAGVGFVQSLASAKFDGMPRSAIDAGLADVIADVDELPAKIMAFRLLAPHIADREEELGEEKAQNALDKIFVLLRGQTGNDFSLYKKSTIQRRIARRMGLHQIDKLGHYIQYLRDNPHEIDLLFREFLIGVTSFFRDPSTWEYLKKEIMPGILASHGRGGVIRAWVPGCSTGEEAYSLAIIFKEVVETIKPARNLTLQLFATDLDREAIERARLGVYPANIAADVSPKRLARFFVEEDRGYRVNKEIREMVVFAPQNVIMDPPFTRLDIVSCRNLLIYLAPELQKKLIPLFHYTLNPGGILFLGSAETIGTYTGLFVSVDGKNRVFRRLEGSMGGTVPVEFPAAFVSRPASVQAEQGASPDHIAAPSLQLLADRVLVQRFSPAAILTSDKGDILYISGRTGKYLEPPVGRASMNLFAMAREGLRLDLTSAFAAALREDRAVQVNGVQVGTNGGTQSVNLTVQRLNEPKELRGMVMVVIADAFEGGADGHKRRTRREAKTDRTDQLERELQRAQEEVQTTREEMQTSQEELKSTNEELQSTNEELQSTNEELMTSKEEMQSMNEELQTVNHELQSKVDELSRSNNDMKNLLNSTDIATLFLDGNLHVRRFTSQMANLIKLIPTDIGRPIDDIARVIDYPDLADDIRGVLRTLVFRETVVPGPDDRWFLVRIMPYRTLENVIDGVVITFTDASARKSMEGELKLQGSEFSELKRQLTELRKMADALPQLVLGFRADGACDYVGPQWLDYTGRTAPDGLGNGWLDALYEEDRDRARRAWRTALQSGAAGSFELRLLGPDGAHRWFECRMTPVRDAHGKIVRWYATYFDVDGYKRAGGRDGASELRH